MSEEIWNRSLKQTFLPARYSGVMIHWELDLEPQLEPDFSVR